MFDHFVGLALKGLNFNLLQLWLWQMVYGWYANRMIQFSTFSVPVVFCDNDVVYHSKELPVKILTIHSNLKHLINMILTIKNIKETFETWFSITITNKRRSSIISFNKFCFIVKRYNMNSSCFLFDNEPRSWLYGGLSSQDEISTRIAELKFLVSSKEMGSFIQGWTF